MATYYVLADYVDEDYFQTGIFIDWGTKVIYVPRFYLTYLSGSVYELDTEQFFRDIRDLEDDEEGMPHPKVIRHSTSVLLGGVEYARIIEIINGYTITFEDLPNDQYIVSLTGSNNNILDQTNLNTTQVQSSNSAGLININQIIEIWRALNLDPENPPTDRYLTEGSYLALK